MQIKPCAFLCVDITHSICWRLQKTRRGMLLKENNQQRSDVISPEAKQKKSPAKT